MSTTELKFHRHPGRGSYYYAHSDGLTYSVNLETTTADDHLPWLLIIGSAGTWHRTKRDAVVRANKYHQHHV